MFFLGYFNQGDYSFAFEKKIFESVPSYGEDVVIVNASKSLKGKWLVDNVKTTPEVVL